MLGMPLAGVGVAGALAAVGVLGALASARWPKGAATIGYGCAALASLALVVSALDALVAGGSRVEQFAIGPVVMAAGAHYGVSLDPLAAFFLLVIGVGGLLAAPYALGYAWPGPRAYAGADGLLAAGFNLFLVSMGVVVLADNALLFLLGWEVMSVTSYFLVVHHHECADVRRAGLLYLITTHIGAAFILLAFLLLAAADGGSLSFAAMRAASGGQARVVRDVAFVCATLGFAAKAGLMPMHFWLPRAHPVAPSHVSALMSGVMLKMAFYGLMRVSLDLLGGAQLFEGGSAVLPQATPLWWGVVLLGLGLVSSVLGALYAFVESDLKRLLAFSSIENMGIVSLGLGAALIFRATPTPAAQALAALAILALCYHILAHTVCKSLLFMVAGAVQHATGVTSLESLGGLVKRMPWTAICACVGALAIAGLPPFNGFVSEWLTFQALLGVALATSAPWLRVLGVVAATGLALTAALAVGTFLKAFGVGFLALPRSVAAERAHEVSPAMRLSMGAGALLAAALGVGAAGLLPVLAPVVRMGAGASAAASVFGPFPALAFAGAPQVAASGSGTLGGGLAPLVLALPLALAPLVWGVVRWVSGPARVRRAETWVCGQTLTPRMAYTAASFAKPVRRAFELVLQPFREIHVTYAAEPHVVERIEYRAGVASAMHSAPVRYMRRLGTRSVELVTTLQNGSIRLYVGYILVTLVLLLVFAR